MKNTRSRQLLMAAALLASMAGAAHAEYLWLQPAADGTLQARAGELHKPLAALPVLRQPKAALADGKTLDAQAQAGQFNIAAPGASDLRFTATRAGEQGVLTYYQARFGRAETRAVNDLELVPTTPQGSTFQLVFKGRAVSASQVVVETSEGWRRVLTPAKDGTVSFNPSFPGLYVMEVTARVDNGSVTVDGKTYQDVRHTATLSFDVKP